MRRLIHSKNAGKCQPCSFHESFASGLSSAVHQKVKRFVKSAANSHGNRFLSVSEYKQNQMWLATGGQEAGNTVNSKADSPLLERVLAEIRRRECDNATTSKIQ